jgi:hypothetical protein
MAFIIDETPSSLMNSLYIATRRIPFLAWRLDECLDSFSYDRVNTLVAWKYCYDICMRKDPNRRYVESNHGSHHEMNRRRDFIKMKHGEPEVCVLHFLISFIECLLSLQTCQILLNVF